MRILVLTPVYPHRGNEVEGLFNEAHALALRDLGVDVTVVLCKPRLPDALARILPRYRKLTGLPRRVDRRGVTVLTARYTHLPGYRLPGITIGSLARSVLRVVEREAPEGFDLIQVHSCWPVGLAAPAIAHRLGRPYVLTLHIEDDPELYATRAGGDLYRRALGEAAAVVAVGSPLLRFLQEQFPPGDLPKVVERIPNGVDPALIRRVREGTRPAGTDGLRIVSVCNLWRVKGVDVNLEALGILRRRGIDAWWYTVVGDGPERAVLERLAARLGIADRVRFVGRMAHEEALREMASADLFSLPSRREAFGIVFLEAMASGLPAVGCLGTGAEDLIREGVTGLLVPPDDPEALATVLERLLADAGRRRELGAAGRLRAQGFTWREMAERYHELYRRVGVFHEAL